MRADDLAPLLGGQPAAGVGYRQGVVIAWDQATAANTVDVGGSQLSDLPILNTSESALLAPGDVVGILTIGSSWAILGRLTIPSTPEAVSALQALRTQSADEPGVVTTTSTSYVDLGGPEVPATIGPTGRALVVVGAEIAGTAATGQAIATGAGYMSYVASGANTVAAVNGRAAYASIRYDASPNSTMELDIGAGVSRVSLLTGLVAGSTTFSARYSTSGAVNTATFSNRNITVLAL